MRMSGRAGARAYLARYKSDPYEIDETLASLLRRGYVTWDSDTEVITLTQKGILETHEGTIH